MGQELSPRKSWEIRESLVSRVIWGVECHYRLEFVVGLLSMWEVDTDGLSVSWVCCQNQKGREAVYIAVKGPDYKMKTLDKKKDFLKSRGWTVDDRNMGINQGNGRGGWGTAMAPAPQHQRRQSRYWRWERQGGHFLTARVYGRRWRT